MYKLFTDNILRTYGHTRRPAFSLAEMVVAMGVLVLMLTLAGQVFSLTVQSTGQATALVHLNQSIRSFEETVRTDLRSVYAGQSVMVIQGNPIEAYWTADDRDGDDDALPSSGYLHAPDPERDAVDATGAPVLGPNGLPIRTLPRGDLLMMFTNRKGRSFVDAEIQSDLQQVVYGHASTGEYVRTDGADPAIPFEFESAIATGSLFPKPDPNDNAVAPFPSQQWHLARRSVQLISSPAPELVANGKALDWFGDLRGTGDGNGPFLADTRLLSGAFDVIVNFNYETLVQQADLNSDPDSSIIDWRLPPIFGIDNRHAAQAPFKRSLMDTTPPPLYANRLGHYLLPNCASFKVEWSLNPRSDFVAGRLSGVREILWIDPGQTDNPVGIPDPVLDDSLATLQTKMLTLPVDDPVRIQMNKLINERSRHADGSSYSLTDRLRSDQSTFVIEPAEYAFTPLSSVFNEASDRRANTHVFTATKPVWDVTLDEPVSPPDYVPDDVFPSALRITIDVYDPQQRLERPMRHVIIATIGG